MHPYKRTRQGETVVRVLKCTPNGKKWCCMSGRFAYVVKINYKLRSMSEFWTYFWTNLLVVVGLEFGVL